MAQFDVKKVRQIVDMLIIEIDKEKYKEYLSSGSVNLTETRRYCHVITKTYESGDKELYINQRSFESMAAKPSYEQNPLREGVVLPKRSKKSASQELRSATEIIEQD